MLLMEGDSSRWQGGENLAGLCVCRPESDGRLRTVA